jgi:hypothetical protein
LHAHLPAHGRLLIITRPQWLDWPLFESAKAAFAQHQPSLASIEAEFAQSGFALEVAAHTYAFTLPKATWHQMLRARFISDLHALTDAQIEAGIAQLEAQNPTAHYTIPDKLLFILAKK